MISLGIAPIAQQRDRTLLEIEIAAINRDLQSLHERHELRLHDLKVLSMLCEALEDRIASKHRRLAELKQEAGQ